MNVFLSKKNCCGCSACAQVCPRQSIIMKSDEEGFLYPVIDELRCINCGLCQKVCPIHNCTIEDESVLSAYAAYVKDHSLRKKSSSGGIFSCISEEILYNDGVVVGAMFDESFMVFHKMIKSIENLDALRGSKYLQSRIENTYIETKSELEKGRTVLFSGTACQIAGLKAFLQKDYERLYTVDILCHGVPSPKVWKTYLSEKESFYKSKVQKIFFRQKHLGWKMFSMELQFCNNQVYQNIFSQDSFMRFFLSNICLRPSCHECKFKCLHRVSDITIGDAWGIDKYMPHMDDDMGTSIVLLHTKKGESLLHSITEKIELKQGDVNQLLPEESDSRKSVLQHPRREVFFRYLNRGADCEMLLDIMRYAPLARMKKRVKQIIKSANMILFREKWKC